MFTLNLSIAFDLEDIAREVMPELSDRFLDHWLDAVDEFQRNTPVGATGDLKRGWDIEDDLIDPFTYRVGISNNAPSALYRIAGRGPGRMPPHQPIYRWAASKGIEDKTYAIRRAIALKGTRRWIEKKNWVGINNDGSFIEGGRLLQIIEQIKKDLSSPI